jgi:hypothetical protein
MAGNYESAQVLRKKPFLSFDEVTLAAKVTRLMARDAACSAGRF